MPLALACSNSPPVAPATPQTETQAIRNGTREPQVVPLSDGQVLSLGWLFAGGDPQNVFCTGTLVTPRHVVTAQHCTQGNGPREIGFGVGVEPSAPTATFRLAAIYQHPESDISVLELTEDATASVPSLVPVAANLAALGNEVIGREVEAGGYGETYDRNRTGRWFAVVQLVDLDGEEVVVDGRQRQGICYGDSGGPIMTELDGQIVVLGVESYGDDSCYGVDHLIRTDWVAEWLAPILGGEPPPDECMGLDYLGRCNGQVAEWCESGNIQTKDCNALGQTCEYVDDETGWFCVEGGECGDVPITGECDGDTVRRCRFGRLSFNDCTTRGRVCRTDASGAFCAPPETPPDGEDDAGVDQDAGGSPRPDADDASPEPREDAGSEPDADETPRRDDAAIAAVDGGAGQGGGGGGGGGSGCASAPGAVPQSAAWLVFGALFVGPVLGRRRRR